MAKFDKKTAYAKIKNRKVVKIIMKNFNKILGKQEEPAEAKEDFKPKNETLKKIGATALVALVALGIFTDGFSFFKKGKNKNITDNRPTTSSSEKFESESGIHDGYDEYGMFLSENKGGQYDFANAAEVAEVCNNDPVEMIKYTAHNQVESFADYLANLPEELQPEGFKGLSILETEEKLESLSDEAFDEVEEYFGNIMDRSHTRVVTVNGQKNNSYIRQKDKNKPAEHNNMQLVKCVTNEHNTKATEFYWQDQNGNEIGSMTVKMVPKYDKNGKIVGYEKEYCEQVLTDKQGNKYKIHIYDGMEQVPQEDVEKSPDKPPVEKKQDTVVDQTKKWGKEGGSVSGDVAQSGNVGSKSKTTKEQKDSTNAGKEGDASTAPGSATNSNGERRETNGDNAYQDQEKNKDSVKKENDAHNKQKDYREENNISPGADNYTDADEAAAVNGGAF